MINSRPLAWSGLLVLALLATGPLFPNAVAQPAKEGYEDADGGPGSNDLRGAQQEFERIITPKYRAMGMRVESLPDGSLRLRLPSEVLFAYDSADINRDFSSTLREVARLMKRHRGVRARIIGHTDNQGSQSYNLDLSLRRAESVATFLSAQGLPNRRLITQGRGEQEPIASNATAKGRQMNRRVDIILFRRDRDSRPARRN